MFTQPYSSNSLKKNTDVELSDSEEEKQTPVFDGEVLKALFQLGKVQVRSEEALWVCGSRYKPKIQLV